MHLTMNSIRKYTAKFTNLKDEEFQEILMIW